jgi:peptidyl-prolyl cis-trans isomerase C
MKILAARRGMLAVALAAGLAATPAFAADKDPVVAVVNGGDIHLSDVVEFQHSLPPQVGQAPFAAILDVLISNRLVGEVAKKEGLSNDPEVKRAVKLAEEGAVRHAWMAKKLRTEVTDATMKQQYDTFVANFKPEDEIHARHILVETEDQAKAVIADLRSGVTFDELAKTKSKDPSAKQNGGDLGFFTKGEMVPAFSDVAFAMNPGDVTQQAVKTQFGWHIIKVEERRKTSVPSFEEAKPVIREQMAEHVAQKAVFDLRNKAKIKTFNPDGTPVKDPAAK